jgi:hypothetical protein
MIFETYPLLIFSVIVHATAGTGKLEENGIHQFEENYSSGLGLEIMLTPGQDRPIGESETK